MLYEHYLSEKWKSHSSILLNNNKTSNATANTLAPLTYIMIITVFSIMYLLLIILYRILYLLHLILGLILCYILHLLLLILV
jgi:hypothetical protein